MFNVFFAVTTLLIAYPVAAWQGAQPRQNQAPQAAWKPANPNRIQTETKSPTTQNQPSANLTNFDVEGVRERLHDYEQIANQLTKLSNLIPEENTAFQNSRVRIQTLIEGFNIFKNVAAPNNEFVKWDQEAWNSLAGGLKMSIIPILKDAYVACENMRDGKMEILKHPLHQKSRRIVKQYLNTLETISLALDEEEFSKPSTPIKPDHYKLFLGYISIFNGFIELIKTETQKH